MVFFSSRFGGYCSRSRLIYATAGALLFRLFCKCFSIPRIDREKCEIQDQKSKLSRDPIILILRGKLDILYLPELTQGKKNKGMSRDTHE
jgi:hypothetical protein